MRLINTIILLLIVQSCTRANVTDPQCSKNINESKRNGFFIARYYVDHRFDLVQVEEAWLESVWYNSYKDGKMFKESTQSYQLIFKLKQDPKSGFLLTDAFRWGLIEFQSKKSVGVHLNKGITGKVSGEYFFRNTIKNIPDSIKFDMLRVINGADVKVGDLVFRRDGR